MLTLYKYTKKRYAENLINQGEIHISPLSAFQAVEKLGVHIGDRDEGKVKYLPGGKVFDTHDSAHNKSVRDLIRGKIEAEHIVLDFAELNINTKNCFIFSASELNNKTIADDLGYDSCVEISDFENFFKQLTDCLAKKGYKIKDSFGTLRSCIYLEKGRVFGLSEELPDSPAFLKEKKHENQKEVRCAWIIEGIDERSFNVKCPELKKYCRQTDIAI
jgi:hypothetical protein